jgi:hypothetical protein
MRYLYDQSARSGVAPLWARLFLREVRRGAHELSRVSSSN